MEAPRPKHAVSEGLMTLAEDRRPEATLLVGSSMYALQHYKTCDKSRLAEYRLVADYISGRIAE